MNRHQLKKLIIESVIQNLNDRYTDDEKNPDDERDYQQDLKWMDADDKKTTDQEPKNKLDEEDTDFAYNNGKKWGVKDKLSGTKRDISGLSPSFQKGYKEVQREGWWQKFNDALTNKLAQFGRSYGQR